MANPQLINKGFTQLSNICATASYGTVIEYFSEGKVLIEHVLGRYVDKFNVFPSSPKVYYFREKHELIYDHFHNYCRKRNMRGFDLIKQLHNGNELQTKGYCQILDSDASLDVVTDQKLASIREKLINHNSLAIILYKVSANVYHAVTVGYDSSNKNYFYKDPNLPEYQTGDILSQKEITEYIVFSDEPIDDQIKT